MKKQLKIKFVDFWPNFDPKKLDWVAWLTPYYDIVESDDPDYIIDGGLGCHHLKYDCVKILRQSENEVPNFNDFDFAVGYDSLSFGDRFVRIPSFQYYSSYRRLFDRRFPNDEALLGRKFCSFVVSNPDRKSVV